MEDYSYTDDNTGIIYRDFENYLDIMIKNPNSVSDDIKLILAGCIRDWISDIIFDLISLFGCVDILLNIKNSSLELSDREKYMHIQKFGCHYDNLREQYNDWKNHEGLWKYINMFTDKEHASFDYYVNKYFSRINYTTEYLFGEDTSLFKDLGIEIRWIIQENNYMYEFINEGKYSEVIKTPQGNFIPWGFFFVILLSCLWLIPNT